MAVDEARLRASLREVFARLDIDGSGAVSTREMRRMTDELGRAHEPLQPPSQPRAAPDLAARSRPSRRAICSVVGTGVPRSPWR